MVPKEKVDGKEKANHPKEKDFEKNIRKLIFVIEKKKSKYYCSVRG